MMKHNNKNNQDQKCRVCGISLDLFVESSMKPGLCPGHSAEPIPTVKPRVAYHGTTTKWGLKPGDEILPNKISGSVNDGAWAALSKEDAREYAVIAAKRFGGNPVMFEVICEGCKEFHDNTCWSLTTRGNGVASMIIKRVVK